MRTCAILELGHRGCCAAADFAAAGAAISQRRVPRFPNDPVLRRCALNRWLILDTAARREQDNRRRKRPNKPYLFDYIECIFHPSVRERAIAVCQRFRVGMRQ